MGWSVGYDSNHRRDIGYGVPAKCDHPGCGKDIDRGLAYVCGGDVYGGEDGCGLFFCGEHLRYVHRDDGDGGKEWSPQLCERCSEGESHFEATPDVQEWIDHKLTCPSWAAWRAENPKWVEANTADPQEDA